MDGQKKDNNALVVFILGSVVLFAMLTVFAEPVKGFIARANYYTLVGIFSVTKSTDVGNTILRLKQVTTAAEFTWSDIWFLTSLTGSYMRWLFLPPLILWLVYIFRKDPKFKFRRKITIKKLLESNARTFFSVRPIVGEDLLSKESYKNHWRPMVNPLMYALQHDLFLMTGKDAAEVRKYMISLHKKRKNLEASLVSDYEYPTFDHEKARSLFESQLGEKIWESDSIPSTKENLISIFKKMPRHKRALATVLLCHYIAEGDLKKDGDKLLETFANSYYVENLKRKKKKKEWTVDALDTTGSDAKLRSLLKDYDIEITNIPFMFHAWSHTLLISLFLRVKTVTTADFIWVKPVDRTLWYVLNNVGRKTYACESAGAFAHFQVETGRCQPMLTPDVDSAVLGLEEALRSEGWLAPLPDS